MRSKPLDYASPSTDTGRRSTRAAFIAQEIGFALLVMGFLTAIFSTVAIALARILY